MLELYHFDRSTAAQKVRIALAEKGLEWESRYIETGFDKREQHDPEYLKINPLGVVPTLVHNGRVIRESNVILEYLEDAFPDHPLRPEDPFERAEMRLWTKKIDSGVHVDSRTVGQCIAMRFRAIALDPSGLPPSDTIQENIEQVNFGSTVLINAMRKWDYPPVSLPAQPFMENARKIWEEIGLPPLTPRAPWFGYELGDWTDRDREEAKWAVEGEYHRTADRAKQQSRAPTTGTKSGSDD